MTRRAAILAHLADHPDLTAHELVRVIGVASHLTDLLRDMEAKAQVISTTGRRPGQGRPVHLWRVAPPGTVPPPRSSPAAEIVARKRERDRIATAARRARGRVPFAGAAMLPGAACAGADPALFFPDPGDAETEAQAVAICAGCPARAACYVRAVLNGERWGVWGGVNLANAGREKETVTTMTDRIIPLCLSPPGPSSPLRSRPSSPTSGTAPTPAAIRTGSRPAWNRRRGCERTT